MILAFEPMWDGTTHGPINGAMLRIVGAAFPEQRLRVLAHVTHLAELCRDPVVAGRIEPAPTALHAGFPGQTHVVSAARFAAEWRAIRAGLRAATAGEPCLILLLSATPTAIWAATLAARLHGRGACVQVALHGNLSDAAGWRPRNPLTRAFDLASTLRARLPARTRFIVFEPSIRDAMARILPRAAAHADVVPHPVNPADLPCLPLPPPRVGSPIRFGFVGQTTAAKGIDVFLDLADRMVARHPGRAAFAVVGTVRPDQDLARYRVLEDPPDTEPLSRAAFNARLSLLDYVVLPFRPGYYDLSASGGLMDAVTWGKPVIATPVPLMAGFAAAYGDIGHIADDLSGVVERLIVSPDPTRYAAQVAALGRARELRTPAALTSAYRADTLAGFPALAGW